MHHARVPRPSLLFAVSLVALTLAACGSANGDAAPFPSTHLAANGK